LTITTQVDVSAAANAAAGIVLVDTAADTDRPVYYFLNEAAGNGDLTLTQIETAMTAGAAATGQAVILIDDGTDTSIYFDAAVQTDAGAGAGLILIGILTGVTGTSALATGDLISV